MAHYKSMYDQSDFLFAFDLQGRPHDLVIEKVTAGEVTGQKGRKAKKPVIAFRGAKKRFAANKTNGATIAQLYGTDTKDWVGKSVTLFPSTTEMDGKTVECIRIKNVAPRSGKSGEALNDVPPPAPADTMSDEERAEIERAERSEASRG